MNEILFSAIMTNWNIKKKLENTEMFYLVNDYVKNIKNILESEEY